MTGGAMKTEREEIYERAIDRLWEIAEDEKTDRYWKLDRMREVLAELDADLKGV